MQQQPVHLAGLPPRGLEHLGQHKGHFPNGELVDLLPIHDDRRETALLGRNPLQQGLALGLDYGLTHSCYAPLADGRPCGHCDSCVLRAKGFAEAGARDPLSIA